jgi:hypothetical protein
MLIFGELSCWTVFGIHKSDPRLIILGFTGVTASVLMLARIRRTSGRNGERAVCDLIPDSRARKFGSPGPRGIRELRLRPEGILETSRKGIEEATQLADLEGDVENSRTPTQRAEVSGWTTSIAHDESR